MAGRIAGNQAAARDFAIGNMLLRERFNRGQAGAAGRAGGNATNSRNAFAAGGSQDMCGSNSHEQGKNKSKTFIFIIHSKGSLSPPGNKIYGV